MDRALLTQQSRVHAETIQLVLADHVDRARGIHTFEHGAHGTEHEIASLVDQDQGRVEISCPDKLENLREGLHDLLDHSLDVVALNGAHLGSGARGGPAWILRRSDSTVAPSQSASIHHVAPA